MVVSWVVVPCILVKFTDVSEVHAASIIRAMSKPRAAHYQTTRRNNPENSHLHTHRRENLKSHGVCFLQHTWNPIFFNFNLVYEWLKRLYK
jgi:hypothetical protein